MRLSSSLLVYVPWSDRPTRSEPVRRTACKQILIGRDVTVGIPVGGWIPVAGRWWRRIDHSGADDDRWGIVRLVDHLLPRGRLRRGLEGLIDDLLRGGLLLRDAFD